MCAPATVIPHREASGNVATKESSPTAPACPPHSSRREERSEIAGGSGKFAGHRAKNRRQRAGYTATPVPATVLGDSANIRRPILNATLDQAQPVDTGR